MADAKKIQNEALKFLGGEISPDLYERLDADRMEREMFRQDMIAAPYGRSPAMDALPDARRILGMDLSSQLDRTILSSFTLSNGLLEQDRPMTATEVIQRQNHTTALDVPAGATIDIAMLRHAMEILTRNNVPMFNDYHWDDDEVLPRPEWATKFEAMAKYPKTFAGPDGMKARLIEDDQAVFDESATMRHCLWRYYTPKIRAGNFIAYHIDTPTLFKHGFTCCFHHSVDRYYDPHIDKEVMAARWRIDQIRGKANSVSKDPDLLAFADTIRNALNGEK